MISTIDSSSQCIDHRTIKPHPNVVALFGVCSKPETPLCIVMEYVSGKQTTFNLGKDILTIQKEELFGTMSTTIQLI